MEHLQNEVALALKHFGYYFYHPTDWNASDMTHRWSGRKDADFIVSNFFGYIGWIEVKNINEKRFYTSTMQPYRQARAFELFEKYRTFFYIVQFKLLKTVFWFTPEDMEPTGKGFSFEPLNFKNRVLPYVEKQITGNFGKTVIKKYLNLPLIPFFQVGSLSDPISKK